MSVSGLCQVCQSAEARFSCERCGSLVCADHYDRRTGLCLECAQETGAGDRGGGEGDRPGQGHRDDRPGGPADPSPDDVHR